MYLPNYQYTLIKTTSMKLTSNLPRFGFCFPASIFSAVDLPIPFVPTNPKTSPGLGVGSLRRKEVIFVKAMELHY